MHSYMLGGLCWGTLARYGRRMRKWRYYHRGAPVRPAPAAERHSRVHVCVLPCLLQAAEPAAPGADEQKDEAMQTEGDASALP